MNDIRECIHYTFTSLALCESAINEMGVCWNCPNFVKGDTITFRIDFPKLHDPTGIFLTIRRNDKFYRRNQVRWVRTADGKFQRCRILQVIKQQFSDLTDDFLMRDTNCNSRDEAVKLLNSFYKKPIRSDEIMTILLLEWLE